MNQSKFPRTTKFLPVDRPTPRGNVYTTEEIEQAIDRLKILRPGALHGELGHPQQKRNESDEQHEARCRRIDETNVSHMVSDLRIEDGHFVGTVTPIGPKKDIVISSFEQGRFALRMLARPYPDRTMRDIQIITFDFVNKDT